MVRKVPETTEILAKKCVGIAGCGGLGSNAAISLVRAGVGNVILVDFDKVEPSNLNRQHFFKYDIGKYKVEALSEHLKSINPDVKIFKYNQKLIAENVKEILGFSDILIEAFDKAESKKMLINSWCKHFPRKPIICGNGVSGIGKTSELKIIKTGNIFFCGDGKSDMSIGLCSARIAIVANMEANIALELLIYGDLRS